jgi:phytoene dehydrogenase-like protein
MSKSHEIVVVGGGSNGLTVAGYLATAGLDVCVVEAQDYVGGGVITREVAGAGFKHDLCSTGHMILRANPLFINDELKLQSKYGLKYLSPETMITLVFPDDSALPFYKDINKTCESIHKFSPKDAESYRRFHSWVIQFLDMFVSGMFSPPASFGMLTSMLDQGGEMGQELLRTLMMSACDVIDEWFESDTMKIACARYASEGMDDPQKKGTGLGLLMFIGLIHKFGWGAPVGGSGQLSEALVRCIEDHGGTVLKSNAVKSFIIKNGKCEGITLETGDEILAKKAVVSTINIKQLPAMIGEDNMPQGLTHKIERLTHSSFSPMNQVLSINEIPKYKATIEGEEGIFVLFCPDKYEKQLKVFDDFKYGIPHVTESAVACWTIIDPSRAPEGKHTLYIYHLEPFHVKDGGWDKRKQEVGDGILEYLQSKTTNMGKENILGRWVSSPLDYSRMNSSFVNGDIMHIGADLVQYGGNRPIPTMNQYRTPIGKFYIAGCSTAPGGGASCGGRAALPIIMEDLGMNFHELVAKKK